MIVFSDELFFATREKGLFEIMRKEQIRKVNCEIKLPVYMYNSVISGRGGTGFI